MGNPSEETWNIKWVSVTFCNLVNTLRPRQNAHHFAGDTFNRIFVNKNVRIAIKISLKFVLKDPINNIPALVQIMAWRRPGNKPLSEPMMVSLLMHICVIRPQWVKYCINGNHTSTEILCRMKSHQQHFNIVQNRNPISTKTIVQHGNAISIQHCAKWKSHQH